VEGETVLTLTTESPPEPVGATEARPAGRGGDQPLGGRTASGRGCEPRKSSPQTACGCRSLPPLRSGGDRRESLGVHHRPRPVAPCRASHRWPVPEHFAVLAVPWHRAPMQSEGRPRTGTVADPQPGPCSSAGGDHRTRGKRRAGTVAHGWDRRAQARPGSRRGGAETSCPGLDGLATEGAAAGGRERPSSPAPEAEQGRPEPAPGAPPSPSPREAACSYVAVNKPRGASPEKLFAYVLPRGGCRRPGAQLGPCSGCQSPEPARKCDLTRPPRKVHLT
jgi:hypothetical protein